MGGGRYRGIRYRDNDRRNAISTEKNDKLKGRREKRYFNRVYKKFAKILAERGKGSA